MSKTVNSLDAVKRLLSGGSMPGEKARGGDQRRYKFPAGTDEVRIRVLPQKDDPSFPMKISIYHYDIPGISTGREDSKFKKETKPNADGKQRGASVKCLSMFGIDCPICKVLKKYEGRAELEDWAGRPSGVANIIIKDDPTQKVDSRLPYVTYFGVGMIKWMDKMYESGDGPQLVNLKQGYDIIIHRKKYNGAFEIRTGLTASPLADTPDKIKEIMAQTYNLADIIGKPDDNLISRSKEAARFLDSEIENKILAMGSLAEGTGDDNIPGFDPDEQIDGTVPSDGTDEGTEGTEVETEGEETETEETSPTPPKTAAKASSAAAKPAAATKTAAAAKTQPKGKEAAPAKAAAKPAAKEAKSKTSVARPNGAPECYADENVHDSNSDKCLECPHEFHCENAIAAAKAG